ncbi:uncharacterized protein LOC144714739 isoform X3 [Wolffia australiana]
MDLMFRARNYRQEEKEAETHLPRQIPVQDHPLAKAKPCQKTLQLVHTTVSTNSALMRLFPPRLKNGPFSQKLWCRNFPMRIREILRYVMHFRGTQQVITKYDDLVKYLDVVEAYFDIILQNEGSFVSTFLDGLQTLVQGQSSTENGADRLLSIIVKVIDKFSFSEDVLAQRGFIQTFYLLNGGARAKASWCLLRALSSSMSLHFFSRTQSIFIHFSEIKISFIF